MAFQVKNIPTQQDSKSFLDLLVEGYPNSKKSNNHIIFLNILIFYTWFKTEQKYLHTTEL